MSFANIFFEIPFGEYIRDSFPSEISVKNNAAILLEFQLFFEINNLGEVFGFFFVIFENFF